MAASDIPGRGSGEEFRVVQGAPGVRRGHPVGDCMIALLQVGSAVPTTPRDLVLNAGTETHVVLAILVVLSLVSWAIMLGVGWTSR